MKTLTADNLKTALWETLTGVQEGRVEPAIADAIASQAREIIRTSNTQLKILQQSHRNVSTSLIDFAEK